MTELQPAGPLKRTPLHALHVRLGGRMVPFAGYALPVQYPSGITKEHPHRRRRWIVRRLAHGPRRRHNRSE